MDRECRVNGNMSSSSEMSSGGGEDISIYKGVCLLMEAWSKVLERTEMSTSSGRVKRS
jgi:hypothetical protein